MKKTVRDFDVRGKRVLVRVDFNVPLDKKTGEITDDKRIRGALPTIQYLVENGARTILLSHLGRPTSGPEAKFSMKPAVDRLSELLGKSVVLADDVIGEDAQAKVAALNDGDVLMLENVRFHKEETKNDPGFTRTLAAFGDLYVNDASMAHRAHASTAGLANYLPSACGFLIEKEIDVMGGALANPKRPFVAILGGAKVSDKIGVIENLIDKVDALIIGGGMAYTFMAAQGFGVGTSLCETDKFELAKGLLKKAEEKGVELLLPVDSVVAKTFAADADYKTVLSSEIPDDSMALDIGEEAIKAFSDVIAKAGTVVWNGPMGVFEFEVFANGTREIARAVAESDAISIIGGGDRLPLSRFSVSPIRLRTSRRVAASLELLRARFSPVLTRSTIRIAVG